MWHYFTINIILMAFTKNTQSDWVEIPQSSNRRTYYTFGPPRYSFQQESPQVFTENYEFPMRTPHTTSSTPIEPTPIDDKSEFIQSEPNHQDEYESEVEVTDGNEEEAETTTENTQNEINSDDKKPEKDEEELGYPGFLPLLKTIQQNLIANVKKSLRSKMDLLRNLRDTLLVNIDERMSNLWKNSYDLPEARGHNDHEMDFPSNEGALMTIGFLTFAVFLIKLVIKLINALKMKQTNGMVPTAMGGTATTYFGRRKRATEEEDEQDFNHNKILQFIEEYQFN